MKVIQNLDDKVYYLAFKQDATYLTVKRVKYHTNGNGAIGKHINLPKELVGKKVRFVMEIIEDKEGTKK